MLILMRIRGFIASLVNIVQCNPSLCLTLLHLKTQGSMQPRKTLPSGTRPTCRHPGRFKSPMVCKELIITHSRVFTIDLDPLGMIEIHTEAYSNPINHPVECVHYEYQVLTQMT